MPRLPCLALAKGRTYPHALAGVAPSRWASGGAGRADLPRRAERIHMYYLATAGRALEVFPERITAGFLPPAPFTLRSCAWPAPNSNPHRPAENDRKRSLAGRRRRPATGCESCSAARTTDQPPSPRLEWGPETQGAPVTLFQPSAVSVGDYAGRKRGGPLALSSSSPFPATASEASPRDRNPSDRGGLCDHRYCRCLCVEVTESDPTLSISRASGFLPTRTWRALLNPARICPSGTSFSSSSSLQSSRPTALR